MDGGVRKVSPKLSIQLVVNEAGLTGVKPRGCHKEGLALFLWSASGNFLFPLRSLVRSCFRAGLPRSF
jgi:hypothetical protein